MQAADEGQWELCLKTQHGTYVKEAISGEDGMTRPSISSILGVTAECVELDVLAILEIEPEDEEEAPAAPRT